MKTRPSTLKRVAALACFGVSALGAASYASAGYEVTAFGNTAGYKQIMDQDYAAANEMLRMPNYDIYRYPALSNLCISRLKSHDVEGALASCDKAVNVAPTDLSSTLSPGYHKRSEVLTHLYSNRGVVRAVSGDLTGARDDFLRALELDESNAKARRNLELVSAGDVAQGAD